MDTLRTGTDSPVKADSSTEIRAVHQHRVGGHPIALGRQHHIPAHHIPARDAHLRPVAHHQRPRRRQIAQRGQRPLGLVLLIDRDHDDHEDHQHDRVERLGQQKVHQARTKQKHNHRLPDDVPRLLHKVARLLGRQLVRPVAREPTRGILRRQARRGGIHSQLSHQNSSAASLIVARPLHGARHRARGCWLRQTPETWKS